jgi:hypothetical protein
MVAPQEERAAHLLLSPTNGGMWDLVLSHAHDLISAFRDSPPCVDAAEEAYDTVSSQQQHSASVPAASTAVSLWADGQCPRRLLVFAAARITLVLQPILHHGQPVCVLLVCVGAPPPPGLVSIPPSPARDSSYSPFASPIERVRSSSSGTSATVGVAHDSACVVLSSHSCGRLDELRRRAIGLGLGLDADTDMGADCDVGKSRSEGDTTGPGLGTDRTIGCSLDTGAAHKGTATLVVPIAGWWARTLLLCDAFAAHAFADSAPLCFARALNESYRRSVATVTAHSHAAATAAAASTCIDWSRVVRRHRGDATAPPAQWSFPSVCELLFAAHADGLLWAQTGRDIGGSDSLGATNQPSAATSSSAAAAAVGGAIAVPPVRRASMPRRPSLPISASVPVEAAPTQPSVAPAASASVDSVLAPAADQSAPGGPAAIVSSVPSSSSAASGGNPRARRYHAQSAAAAASGAASGAGAQSGMHGNAATAVSSAAEGEAEPAPQTFVPAPPPMAVRVKGHICDWIGAAVSVCLLAIRVSFLFSQFSPEFKCALMFCVALSSSLLLVAAQALCVIVLVIWAHLDGRAWRHAAHAIGRQLARAIRATVRRR